MDLQEKALSQRYVELQFDLSNQDPNKRCLITPNPCEKYLKEPTPNQMKLCKLAHAQVEITFNDPTCNGATSTQPGSTKVCIAPAQGAPRQKVFISAVIGVFGKLLGASSCGFPACLPPWETHGCGDDYYLNSTSSDPWTWKCAPW